MFGTWKGVAHGMEVRHTHSATRASASAAASSRLRNILPRNISNTARTLQRTSTTHVQPPACLIARRKLNGHIISSPSGLPAARLAPTILLSRPSPRRIVEDEHDAVADRPYYRVQRLPSPVDVAEPAV